jgi:hypothetical protein
MPDPFVVIGSLLAGFGLGWLACSVYYLLLRLRFTQAAACDPTTPPRKPATNGGLCSDRNPSRTPHQGTPFTSS